MKKLNIKLLLLLAIALIIGGNECHAADGVITPTIYPQPAECEISATDYIPLTAITIRTEDATAKKWADEHLKQWYGKFSPTVTQQTVANGALADEEYELTIGKQGITVNARTLQGVRYALYSLRQIAIAGRGTTEVAGWIAPVATIKDKPKTSFRGVHICWFRETEPWQVERLIRMAAYYKMNYAIIESWGTFRSDVAPWFGWKDGTMTKKEIKRLKKIADDLGITLIPQINVFGHATQARSVAGKHATLDINPKYQPLFEPLNGWNWCLTNPDTRKLLQDLIKERYEAFGCPPFFHIGGDEAHLPSCPDCAAIPYSQLFLDHIKAMNKTISSLGARTMMWHDMLLERGDKRWDGFYAFGSKKTANGFLEFPRDIIICDWHYGAAKSAYPTIDYFKEQGFSVLTSPWNSNDGTIAQGRYAQKAGIMGVLGTLWHHYFGTSIPNIFYTLSNATWNPESEIQPAIDDVIMQRVYLHLRHVGWDMKLKDARHAGSYYDEVPAEPFLNN